MKKITIRLPIVVFLIAGSGYLYNIWFNRLSLVMINDSYSIFGVEVICNKRIIKVFTTQPLSRSDKIIFPRCEGSISLSINSMNRDFRYKCIKYAPSGFHEIRMVIPKTGDLMVETDGKEINEGL
jgi:hypothetical protein